MPVTITMPALSPTMTEGTVAAWLVAEGENVLPGDMIILFCSQLQLNKLIVYL